MDTEQLEERIAEFPRWNYRFEFEDGVTTPVLDPGVINRHAQRRRYFFDALLGLTGGSLAGHRVLDLGCNAGFWTVHALEAGADFVLGIDGQEMAIEQARLVAEAKSLDPARCRFEHANLFGHEFGESFDIVLCLGIMEVTSKPVELFELMSGVGAELIVIDTAVSGARSSFFEIGRLNEPRNRIDHEITLVPTRGAVCELAAQFGFQTAVLEHNMTDFANMDDYRRRRRFAFICARDTPLDALPQAPPARFGGRLDALNLLRGR